MIDSILDLVLIIVGLLHFLSYCKYSKPFFHVSNTREHQRMISGDICKNFAPQSCRSVLIECFCCSKGLWELCVIVPNVRDHFLKT